MAKLLGLLPIGLQILGAILKWYGAGEDVLEKYITLVQSTEESGLITVNTRDKLMSQREKILARLKDKTQVNPPT